MNTREQSAAIKKTVVENVTRELVLEHACELVETFPVSKEKALILFVIRSWDFLRPSFLPEKKQSVFLAMLKI